MTDQRYNATRQTAVDGGAIAFQSDRYGSLRTTARSGDYETVAASQTDQALGATGAAGDYLSHIVIQPAATTAGTVTVKDGTTVIFTFTTGTLADLSPKTVPFGIASVNGAWKITTGASVAVIGVGNFT